MVRVISVHNFSGLNVGSVEQPTASCSVPPDLLLLAMTSNRVDVRDIRWREGEEINGGALYWFPTVDEVVSMCHSVQGDYVATVESKYNRQNHKFHFARCYLNWRQQLGNGHETKNYNLSAVQRPMRARIAGRVTPTIVHEDEESVPCLEMIEIPLDEGRCKNERVGVGNPNAVTCCPISGNLCILSEHSVTIFTLSIKTHDISRVKFLDFENTLNLEVKFKPKQVEFREGYLGVLGEKQVQLMEICNGKKRKTDEKIVLNNDENLTIDFDNLKFSQIIDLPSISAENSFIFKQNPSIIFERNSKIVLKNHENMCLKQLVHLSVKIGEMEEFRCMVLKPLYSSDEKESEAYDEKNLLRSKFKMSAITFLVATQQEAFLYYFSEFDDVKNNGDGCIAVYNFTAPLYHLVMEDSLLHAVTECGLESYTLRNVHKFCQKERLVCPPVTEAVCLVGLRPFLGIEKLLLSDSFLILLANADASPTHSVASSSSSNASYWTLYALELPTAASFFTDIYLTALVHQFTAMRTYRHLLNEAHSTLRAKILFQNDFFSENSSIKIARKLQRMDKDEMMEKYKMSCGLLADHFMMSETSAEHDLCLHYYKMAGINPHDAVKRAKKLQKQSNIEMRNGLTHYLTAAVLENDFENFSEEFFKIFENDAPEKIPEIFLKSQVFREAASADRVLGILRKLPENNNLQITMCILYVRKNQPGKCAEILKNFRGDLFSTLWSFPDILFETNEEKFSQFSDFSDVIITNFPVEYSMFLVELVNKGFFNLKEMLQLFLDYLPASRDQRISTEFFQHFLENYFREYFKKFPETAPENFHYKCGFQEALNLLCRLYLSKLRICQFKTKQKKNFQEIPDVFPSKFRHAYLDKIAPFQRQICLEDSENICRENPEIFQDEQAKLVLVKLQTILCVPSAVILENLKPELKNFLKLNDHFPLSQSLLIIIWNNEKALNFLLEKWPQALPQFTKDRLERREDLQLAIRQLQLKTTSSGNYYWDILKEILIHLASSSSPDELIEIFPKNECCDNFRKICAEIQQADQIKKLIGTTGQQLLCTLNL